MFCDALAKRKIVRVLALDDASLRCPGVALESASTKLQAALSARDAGPLAALLRELRGSALGLRPNPGAQPGTVGSALQRLEYVVGLRGVVLSPEVAVYAPERELTLTREEREAMAYVARALFRGAREPSVASFPASLRRVERVEVLVTLSKRGEPRLWRSARGTSIARALLTATRVARDRWREREQAMGGPLPKQLLQLDVEVALLSEDGTLASTQAPFINRVLAPAHGLGFDHRTAWHYTLPGDLARNKKKPFDVLATQIADQGLTLAILAESDTRVYRFVQLPLSVSKAPLAATPEAGK